MSAPEQPAIVVAGDALIDLTPTLTVRGTTAYEPHPGASCLNVAVGLGRLDVPTAFLARVSTDHFGELLRQHLVDSGVLTTHLIATADLTTLAAVHLVDGQASYSFHAAQAADRGLLPEHLAELPDGGALPPGAALHLGSIALVLEPVASTLEGLLRREARRRLISLDPNVRPSLIADRTAYLQRLRGWTELVDVLTEGGGRRHGRGGRRLYVRCPRAPARPGPAGPCGGGRPRRRAAGRAAPAAVAVAAFTCTRPGANPPRKAELRRDLGAVQ